MVCYLDCQGMIGLLAIGDWFTLDRPGAEPHNSFRPSKGVPVPSRERDEILQGTLDMLVLKTLALGDLHGWGITERIEHGSRSAFHLNQGSLYPALYRLERQGLVTSR